MKDNCQRCGAIFNRKAINGKFCPACQKKRGAERSSAARKKRFQREKVNRVTETEQEPNRQPVRLYKSSFEVIASPTYNGMDDWPRGSHLSKLEVYNCLHGGYFPPGLQLKKLTGELFKVVGQELREQKLVKV